MLRRSSAQTAGIVALVATVLLLATAGSALAAKKKGADAKYVHRDGGKTLEELVKAEVADAKKARKDVVLIFTADWCAPCKTIKNFLEESRVVQKSVKKGRFLFIDVDEWRPAAQNLVRGINARKLPTLVNVDANLAPVQSCFGTELGLISDQAVASNLKRLLDGKKPQKAEYQKNKDERRELILAQARKDKARVADVPPVEVKVRNRKKKGGITEWKVRLAIQNHDSRRRFYAIPLRVGSQLAESSQTEGWEAVKYNEHIRAYYYRFQGESEFMVIPVGGLGSVVLDNFTLAGPSDSPFFEVWELKEFKVDGTKFKFDKKVPYKLAIENADKVKVIKEVSGVVEVLTPSAKRFPVELK